MLQVCAVFDLFQPGIAVAGVCAVALPHLVQADAAVGQDRRGAPAVTGDHLPGVQDHAVGEVQGAVVGAASGQGAAPGVPAGEVTPQQVALLVVDGDPSGGTGFV